MADITVYKKTARTGGGANAMDGIDGSSLVNGAFVFVFESGRLYFYLVNTTGAAPENDPLIIVPDLNPGNINFELNSIIGIQDTIFKEVTIDTGVVTLIGPGNYHIDTEGDAASDTVTSFAGLNEGERAILAPESDARTVTIQNNSSILLQDIDHTMDNANKTIEIQGVGSSIVRELSRSSRKT